MKKLSILLVLVFFLSGCWDVNESERMLYVHGIGIDFKDEEYLVYFQIISFLNVAKREDAIDQTIMQAEVGFAKGKTIEEAITNLYKSMDEPLFWGHLSVIILKNRVINNGHLNTIVNGFTRFYNTRYNTWVYITDESIEDFFMEEPLLSKAISLTKLANPLNSYENKSYIEPITVRQLLIDLNEPNHIVALPYIEFKEDIWITEKGKDSTIEMDSVGIITPNQFLGFIKGDDARGFQWMTNATNKSTITTNINEEGEKENYISITIQNHSVKIKPIIDGNDVKFDIDVSVAVTLDSYNDRITQEVVKKATEKQIKKEIEHTFKKGLELESDVYRLSEKLYRKNVKLWKKLEEDGSIPMKEDTIRNINVYVYKIETGRKKFSKTVVSPDEKH